MRREINFTLMNDTSDLDIIDPVRSRIMASVKGKDTKPEMRVRKLAHALGYRYRLHRKDLPGTPDLVFPARAKVVFVHGCFWHRHRGCRKTTTPGTRQEFWLKKFEANIQRDEIAITQLNSQGWKVLIVWECETNNIPELAEKLANFLE